jgi:DNA primase catalytic subunit
MQKRGFEYRISTFNERIGFYGEEFSFSMVKRWFKENGIKLPQLCAIDAGTDTGILKNKKWKGSMFYFKFKELPEKIRKYTPEDIYYDRNVYTNAEKVLSSLKFEGRIMQELVFDVDADNIKCKNHGKEKVCNGCLKKALKFAVELERKIRKTFKKTFLVYSGRGFHVHVEDEEAFSLSFEGREALNKKLKKFPIDPWVSAGHIRLIRMPFSLNSLVSRIVIPLNRKNVFEESKTLPEFLKL